MGIYFEDVDFVYNSFDKKYPALQNINIGFKKEGELVFVIGKTGSGKSTLFELCNALCLPSKGIVEILGQKVKKKNKIRLTPLRQKVGLVFQFPEYQLFSDTVLKDISFGPKNFKQTKKDATKLALDAANALAIEKEILDKSPFKISGGQMRKVAIAGILALNPSILLLDEPTRGLDPMTSSDIVDKLYQKFLKDNKTMIFVSHDLDLAFSIATRIVVIENGKIIKDKPKKEYTYEDFENFNIGIPSILKIKNEFIKTFDIKDNHNIFTYEQLANYLKEELK